MSELSSKAKKLFDEFNYSQTVYHAFLASGINNEYIEKKRKMWDAKRESFEEYVVGLESRIAELEAAQRWIPVDEKPLEAGVYFVRLKNGVTKIDWTFIDGGIYYWWNSGQDSVTHYMPLPESPNDTQKDTVVYG